MRLFELPGTFSIAHQHSLQLVPPLDAMLQLSIVVCYSRELILRAFGRKIRDGHLFAHLNHCLIACLSYPAPLALHTSTSCSMCLLWMQCSSCRMLLARINFMCVGRWAKNTRRSSFCTLESLPDASLYFMQFVPPLGATIQLLILYL